MYYGLSGTSSFSSDGVIEFKPISAADINSTITASATAQLNLDTPGGASVQKWSESGYSTDPATVSQVLAAGMIQSKNRVVQEAGQAALQMGSTMAAACSTTGVGSAIAPLCGAMGSVIGAIAGAITASAAARHEAGVALREGWWGANHALLWGVMAIRNGSQGTGAEMTDAEAVCLLVNAMKRRGSSYTDRIWGPYTTKAAAHDGPCGIPGLICKNAIRILQSAQGHRPLPVLPSGQSYPSYAIVEKWWMLKSDHYGNCVNDSDLKPDAVWQDKKKTRRTRAARMREIANEIVDAVEVVIATIINLRDARSRELAEAYYRSEVYAADIRRTADAATGMQQSYGEFMHESSVALQRYCSLSQTEAGQQLAQGSDVFLPMIQQCKMQSLLDMGYDPDEAMQIIAAGPESIAAAEGRARMFRIGIVAGIVAVIGVGGYTAYTRFTTGRFPAVPVFSR